MAEVDVSTYPRALPTASPLDIAGKLGGLEAQRVAIDTAKMEQANKALGFMTRAMGSLGPNASINDYIGVAQNAVKQGLVPQAQLNAFVERAQAAKSPQQFYNEFMTAAQGHQDQINYHLGQRVDVGNGQTVTPAVTSVKPGFGVKPVGLPVQQQAPPTTQTVDEQGQPRLLGPQPTQLPEGAVPANTGIPGQFRLPAERPQIAPARVSGPTGPTVDRTAETPTNFANRFPQPSGPATGASPLFEEGKKAYTTAQLKAGANAQAIKPAIQALKLMPGLATGPGTAQWNDLVATAKAWGIVDTKAENDPTVMRQEVEKKLAQFVGSSPIGQRSDAAQTLAEAGSPNPKKQILPALQNLTRDAIALYRIEQIMPQAFKGRDYQNFIKHQGTFPQTVDEKALTLDLLPEEERTKLVKKMAIQYEKGNAREKAEANKFKNTLTMAKEAGLFSE